MASSLNSAAFRLIKQTFSHISVSRRFASQDKNPKIQTFLADPQGSVLYKYFTEGKLERTDGSSITEGIGQGRITKNLEGAPIDQGLLVMDADAVKTTFSLLYDEGFFVGASSGLNVAGAVQAARLMGPGHTVVTCLCDTGHKYYSRLFSRDELEKRGLLECIPEAHRHSLH
ncbi:hypothetical protein CAPTEDRAFT_227757 [Capitella teleta]|uniref:Tryptophan synthase beta chain-like PALP domain-containing protein n=1 Tax=Capitella teleta TaxID=283909 RepID=R7UAM8_CAPTE|nr:hypothetical protein CAPTEDRAFT_227757 [Capitella teleta]|eukprot:ELU00863.1 hypothetical protein CAPTEDRAFT_227757 [Capitella teleta]